MGGEILPSALVGFEHGGSPVLQVCVQDGIIPPAMERPGRENPSVRIMPDVDLSISRISRYQQDRAGVAQLVERYLAKVVVVGSKPITRFNLI